MTTQFLGKKALYDLARSCLPAYKFPSLSKCKYATGCSGENLSFQLSGKSMFFALRNGFLIRVVEQCAGFDLRMERTLQDDKWTSIRIFEIP